MAPKLDSRDFFETNAIVLWKSNECKGSGFEWATGLVDIHPNP